MNDIAKIISTGLSVTQALQVIAGLVASVREATAAGQADIPAETLRAHLGQLDASISNLEQKLSD